MAKSNIHNVFPLTVDFFGSSGGVFLKHNLDVYRDNFSNWTPEAHCAYSFVLFSPTRVSESLPVSLTVSYCEQQLSKHTACHLFVFVCLSEVAEDDTHIRKNAVYPRSVLIAG